MSAEPIPNQPETLGGDGAALPVALALDDSRTDHAITDFFLPDEARLDERTRLLLASLLDAVVGTVETDIRRHAARLLSGRGAMRKAEALLADDARALTRLMSAGLLRDAELMEELLGRVRADLLAEALPVAVDVPDRPSLLVRLAALPDTVVAAAAAALLAQENRRAEGAGEGEVGAELPAELHHRLVWWVAAAIRERSEADPDTDRAIGEAAHLNLSAHDESERVEVAAVRLAAAIDPLPGEVAVLLAEAIGDRRLPLFVAVLARALDMEFEATRAIVIDPGGERLWLALRAVGLDRTAIARIALALADADPRRDIERFADRLDDIAAIDAADARAALAPLSLPRSFRAAIRALARRGPR
jgi:hypothetical protein